ncbi:hypothetical protein LQ382_07335 [Rhodococcus rhodochrous]|uniref:hypothetical protein n=1 Tax=Rhodococcus rhodochrous TaxID=1829 RepID=UPI001E57A924|nr:hypothetical protein [Rhodococcus rhodochrous]MCD2096767.1 hypothetical protein [Rhodococcus rhodochrous]MCD2121702.1 hypothetical protein [Rhodococcus rhodochrous]MDJ0018565.1 hypothetical protein [Rhodococcus rhodochrous]
MAHSDARRHAAPTPSDRHAILVAAAFGPTPGTHPLPAAHGPEQIWLRAVALGGQGRYAAARAELTRVRGTGKVWSSFGASTEASLLRQLGGHRAAAVLDGRALAEAGPLRTGSGNTVDTRCDAVTVAARCDAATGLAADALGRGRLAVCGSLLDRCATALDAAESEMGEKAFLRQRIRLAWVGAESALAAGDFTRARSKADRAVELADGFGSIRHSVKSDLVRAASLTGLSDHGPAVDLAADVLARAEEHGLVPLQWAAAMLLDGLGAGGDAGRVRDIDAGRVRDIDAGRVRDLCATLIVGRGGRFVTSSAC